MILRIAPTILRMYYSRKLNSGVIIMRLQIKLFLAAAIFSTTALAQYVTTEIVQVNANKPVFLNVKTRNIGPQFQCYYGLTTGRGSAFPVFLNPTPLNIFNDFYFSNTYEFSFTDTGIINGFEFASIVECWILGEGSYLATSAEFSVELKQEKNGPILFKDNFSGFVQRGRSDLWRSSPQETIKRIKFRLN